MFNSGVEVLTGHGQPTQLKPCRSVLRVDLNDLLEQRFRILEVARPNELETLLHLCANRSGRFLERSGPYPSGRQDQNGCTRQHARDEHFSILSVLQY